MRCVGTDLKFHWVRHDEDDAPAAEASPIDGSKRVGEAGAADKSRRAGDGSAAAAALTRRGSMQDRLLQKRKVGADGWRTAMMGGVPVVSYRVVSFSAREDLVTPVFYRLKSMPSRSRWPRGFASPTLKSFPKIATQLPACVIVQGRGLALGVGLTCRGGGRRPANVVSFEGPEPCATQEAVGCMGMTFSPSKVLWSLILGLLLRGVRAQGES